MCSGLLEQSQINATIGNPEGHRRLFQREEIQRAEWEAYRRLLRVREDEYLLGVERVLLENVLKLAIRTAAGLEGVATWKTRVRQTFDEPRFKREEYDTWQAFQRESSIRTLRLR